MTTRTMAGPKAAAKKPRPAATAPASTVAVDAERWPDVAVAAGSPVRTAVARAVFTSAVARLPLLVRLPDGHVIGGGGPGAPVMVLARPREFYRRFGAAGLIGFGESYLAGEWDAAGQNGNDLTRLLTVLAEHAAELVPPWLQRLRKLAVRRHPRGDRQTVAGARRNIGRHYDLSNDLFALFLDETMTYSSALFTDLETTDLDETTDLAGAHLAEAQRRKIDRLLDRAGVSRGCRVLEIGTGWGELAIRAARRGATVHTVTISREQAALATRRIAEAGLAGQVRVDLCDYRDVQGQFDAICSVEMIEAVGDRYWDTFFTALDQHLAPGGRVGLQTITMAHDRMLATRHTYTWIQKYIFPGGLLPSVTAIGESLSRTRLRIVSREDFGLHYAETLRLWREQFSARADQVAALGFDEVFRRMWNFYLSYTEAGFRAGYIDVSQLTLARI